MGPFPNLIVVPCALGELDGVFCTYGLRAPCRLSLLGIFDRSLSQRAHPLPTDPFQCP